jgi:hypothetical protein
MSLWKNSIWRGSISEALSWYLGANELGTGICVEMCLILAQTALELLAWTYCVRYRKMISPEAFEPRGIAASDKLRLLASALDIPLDIPKTLSALYAKRGCKWKDAADAITGIRNNVVHPHDKERLPEKSGFEAWLLSMWHLDMALLRLCKHTGKYSNRLKVRKFAGQVEALPWAKTQLDEADT